MANARSGEVVRPHSVNLRDLGLAALVICLTFGAYLPSLGGEFIWNDSDYVTAPALRSLAGLGAIWFRLGATEQYYPLLHSFFWVQHRLFGDHPFGYHIVTLLLHSGAAILFALGLRRLAVPGAWLAALLFALHPVHVESVAWITEQKNTLSLLFYLAAALVYLDFDETRRPRAYLAALGLFMVSLLCKTVTVTLPAALLVLFWWKRGRLGWRRDFRPLLPWLALGAAAGLFSSWVEKHYLGAKGVDFDLPLLERGLVAGRAVWFYLGQLVWPFDLNFIYVRWTPDPAVWWQWLFPLGLLGLAGVLWLQRHRSRALLAGFLFFIGSLFPVLGFVNLYGGLYSFVWDHWQYLADLGPLALAGAALSGGWERVRPVGPFLGAVLVGLCAVLTWYHGGMFHDDVTLYRATLARNPSAWMAHYNLGCILMRNPADVPEAVAEFETTLRLRPEHMGARGNLAGILVNDPARLPEAVVQYEAVLRMDPAAAEAHYNLASALAKTPGRLPDAIAEFEAALRIKPDHEGAHYNLANALAKIPGRLPDAIAHYRAALQINPNLAEAHYNLGIALLSDPAQMPEAVAHFEAALRTRPDFELAREIVDHWRAAQH